MLNPVLSNRKNLLIYLLIWAAITTAQIFFFHFYFHIGWLVSLTDSLVYNFLFLILGIGIWYIVMYNDFEIREIPNLIVAHTLSAVILIGIWLSFSAWLMHIIISDPQYTRLSGQLFPSRIVLGIFYYLVIILVYYLLIYYLNFKDRLRREAAMETRAREAELNTLKAQINPHFLFNSLNSINSLTVTDPDKAREMIVKLSNFLRLTLKNTTRQFTTLDEEVKFAKLYFEIEKIRFGEKLSFQIKLPDRVKNLEVPNLLLQPLVENAIKHGVQERIGIVDLRLSCFLSKGFLVMELINQFDQDVVKKAEGVGLNNVRDRLELIYRQSGLLNIEADMEEFKVTVMIPVKS